VARIGVKKWPERWSNGYSFLLEATKFALISSLVKLREIKATVVFWEDSGKEQILFLIAPLLVCLAPAITYLQWPYVFTFVEGTLLQSSFVDRSLIGGDSIDVLHRTINVLEARVLVGWRTEK